MPEVQLHSLGVESLGVDEASAWTSPEPIRHFPCVIGRHPECGCRVADPLVSRRHCVLTVRDGQVWVEDLGSRNGTRLNGEVLQGPLPLDDGDELEVGHLAFQVRVKGGAAAEREDVVWGEVPQSHAPPVLVVEDNEATARALAELLQSWGHRVRVAHDGPKALEEAREDPPAVVLMDIGLPGMSGLEVARRLRNDLGLNRTRMVAVTGDEGATEVLQSRGQFERLLIKPVTPGVLQEVLHPAG
jgi:CheY-like chemotaxis protein